jgi:protein TonB
LPVREKDFDSGWRFFQAALLSLAAHCGLLILIVIGAISENRPTIKPGESVFITPVSPPAPKAPPEKAPEKEPQPPAPEEPRAKKNSLSLPVKKREEAKIVPRGAKIKPPEPPKPSPEPPPRKHAPETPKTRATLAAQGKSFRIEGEEFKYDYYIKIVKRKVEENWITHGLNLEGQRGNPEVYFRINKDGSVAEIRMEKSSGSSTLDQSALDAVKSASFPPLPPGYKSDYLGVYYDFQYAQKD